jgi:hypothetical protein
VACARGKAQPSPETRIRLFADSAGYCQNPGCAEHLFVDTGKGEMTHFAEMAHIVAASDDGPRANRKLSAAERGAYQNLILLCAKCHTIIDKAPDAYPEDVIRRWKETRAERLAALFGVVAYQTRAEALAAITPAMEENKVVLDTYGPGSEARFDPESEAPQAWRRKMLGTIIPNNKRIAAILDKNRHLMVRNEAKTLEQFRQHTDDLVARHLEGVFGGQMFPRSMNAMMLGDG